MSVTVGDMDRATERRAVQRLLGHRVDGLVLLATKLPSTEIRDLAEQVPLVAVGRRLSGVDVISVDDRAGARLAVEHLIQLGHTNIAHIDGGDGPGARIRRRTYMQAMEANGLSAHLRSVAGDYTEHGGIAAAEVLLGIPNPPTAVFASNDLTALGVLAVAKTRGLDVPNDLSVVGFDNTPLSSLRCVNLTTVSQPRDDLGTAAVAALVARVTDQDRPPRTQLLRPELQVRGTTAPTGTVGFAGGPTEAL